MEEMIEPTVGMKLRKKARAPQVMGKSTPIKERAAQMQMPVARLIRNWADRYRVICEVMAGDDACELLRAIRGEGLHDLQLEIGLPGQHEDEEDEHHDQAGEDGDEGSGEPYEVEGDLFAPVHVGQGIVSRLEHLVQLLRDFRELRLVPRDGLDEGGDPGVEK